jgi:hypothetical protein
MELHLKLKGTLDKTTESEKKEAQAAKQAGQETKGAGDAAKYSDNLFGRFHQTIDTASSKLSGLKQALDPIKTKLLALSAVVVGFGTMAVFSSAKVESMIDELDRLHGLDFSKQIQQWAELGSGQAWSGKSQRLAISLDLADLNISSGDIQKFGTEIEKFYFSKMSSMKRLGVGSAEELTKAISTAAKGGRTEEIRRVMESGTITDSKMNNEMTRLRANYEKFAFATDDEVKQQALLNLVMKELTKTNAGFTGKAETLDQKLSLLFNKFNKLTEGIGQKLEPTVKVLVDGLGALIDAFEAVPGHDEILILIGAIILAFSGLVSWVMILAPALHLLSLAMGSAGLAGAVGGIIPMLTGLIGILGGVAGALGGVAVAAAGALLPFLPIIVAVALIAGALYLLYTRTTVLQDSWAGLTSIATKAQSVFQKLISMVSGAFKGGKVDLQDIGTWVKMFLDGLIPGWLSDIFAAGQGYFRQAMTWFGQIMNWWNNFLKTLGKVYDAIKGILGIGTPGTPEAKPKSPEQKSAEAAGLSNWNSGQGITGRDAGIPTVDADSFMLQNSVVYVYN